MRSLAFATIGFNIAFAWQMMHYGLYASFALFAINASWFAYFGLVIAALTQAEPPKQSPNSPTVAASLKGVDEQLAVIQQRIDRIKATISAKKLQDQAV